MEQKEEKRWRQVIASQSDRHLNTMAVNLDKKYDAESRQTLSWVLDEIE